MQRIILLLLVVSSTALPLFAQQQPTRDVFDFSSRDLAFQIPTNFELISRERTFLKPETHEVPWFRCIWQHGPDSIIISVFVLPDIAWQRNPKQMFADGLIGMLSDPTPKAALRRTYELNGASALSIISSHDKDGTCQRMDWILVKPKVYMVAYLSSKRLSWDDPASKAFFQTLSLSSKK